MQVKVLGPFPFPLYVNDIFKIIHQYEPLVFADDVEILYSFEIALCNSTLALIEEDPKSHDIMQMSSPPHHKSHAYFCHTWLRNLSNNTPAPLLSMNRPTTRPPR